MSEAAKSVMEGEWQDFSFRFVEKEDIPKILEHLTENFYKYETVSMLMNPRDERYPAFSGARVAKMLEREDVRQMSFLAIHKPSGEIAGAQFQFKWTKEEALQIHPVLSNEKMESPPPPLRKVRDLINASMSKTQLGMFLKYNVDYVIWNFITSVTKKFQQLGLASEMYRRMADLLRANSVSLAFSIFTNPYSQRCAEKTGFVEIDRVFYNSVRNEQGDLIFPDSEGDARLMILKLA